MAYAAPKPGNFPYSAQSRRLAQRWTINELLESRMMLAAHVADVPQCLRIV